MYTVKDASTGEVVGFTGWQARVDKSGERVGSYSIGILPEHRGRGFARSALTGLLREKRASVDRVQAFIMPHNLPSMRLAQAFGIQITHEG
jgi:RimJ/RimL family protein N-acetyltransferase